MPPKSGESYDNVYLVNQDGSYAKLTDIKEFDIGASEPPEGLNIGGYVPYDEYKPPVIDTTDYVISGWVQPRISPKLFYYAILGMTERQYRLVLRRAEKIRREHLKRGTKCQSRFVMAFNEILRRKREIRR